MLYKVAISRRGRNGLLLAGAAAASAAAAWPALQGHLTGLRGELPTLVPLRYVGESRSSGARDNAYNLRHSLDADPRRRGLGGPGYSTMGWDAWREGVGYLEGRLAQADMENVRGGAYQDPLFDLTPGGRR
jgi:hypothetical protein